MAEELHAIFARVVALYSKNLAEAFSRLERLVSQCSPLAQEASTPEDVHQERYCIAAFPFVLHVACHCAGSGVGAAGAMRH